MVGILNVFLKRVGIGGALAMIKVRGENIEEDNRWVVPYSPVLLRTFNCHVNVDYCSSVKSIK